MRIQTALLLATVLPLAACAKAPSSIAPAYISEVPYQSFSCKQLGVEMIHLNEALTSASVQQEHARTGDAWGVFLIGMPTSSMSGDNIAPQIASLKGQQVAVQKTMISKNC